MRSRSSLRLGVFAKVSAALLAVLIALSGLAYLSVRSTHDSTVGAERVEEEFAERVTSGEALLTALVNFSIAKDRLRASSASELREHDIDLSDNDTILAQRIESAVGRADEEAADDAKAVGAIRRSLRSYLQVRDRLIGAPATGASGLSLDAAFQPLQARLQKFADGHF